MSFFDKRVKRIKKHTERERISLFLRGYGTGALLLGALALVMLLVFWILL